MVVTSPARRARAEVAAAIEWSEPVRPVAEAAEAARAAAQQMQAQGDETARSLRHALFSSVEIVKQGPLDTWSDGGWLRCHAVLTRCGHLHTLRDKNACGVDDSASLRQFDTVSAQGETVTLRRGKHGWFGREARRTFRADDAAAAAAWLAALRWVMDVWRGCGDPRGLLQALSPR